MVSDFDFDETSEELTEYDNVAQPESDFSDLLPIGTVIQKCPGEKGRPCDGNIVAKQGRFSAFSGCTNFPTCRVH